MGTMRRIIHKAIVDVSDALPEAATRCIGRA